MIKIVTVFGTGRSKPGDKNYALAEQLGSALAGAGFALANGGYGGTMEASAKGASAAGGEVIGVTCSAFGRGSTGLTTGGSGNKYISREILTTSLADRLDTLIKLGAAYVVLPGGTGTLLELAFIWELKNKGFLDDDKPIILLGDYWNGLIELMAIDDADSKRHLLFADSPKDVVRLLKKQQK